MNILIDESLYKKSLGSMQSFATVPSTTWMTGAVNARHKLSVLGVHGPPCWDAAELPLCTATNFKLKPLSESCSSGCLVPVAGRNAHALFSCL